MAKRPAPAKNKQNPTSGRSRPIFEWDKHPVIVAAAATVATALFVIQVFNDVVLPNMTFRLESELRESQQSLALIEQAGQEKDDRIAELTKQIEETGQREASSKEKTALLEAELREAKLAFMLSPGNPYPNGLSTARIGMARAQILQVYSSDRYQIENIEADILTVTIPNSPIKWATYYFDEQTDTVKHILFGVDPRAELPEDFLQRRLVEALGAPTASPKPYFFRWLVSDRWNVLKATLNKSSRSAKISLSVHSA